MSWVVKLSAGSNSYRKHSGTRQHGSQTQLQHEDVIVGAGGERKREREKIGACLNSLLDCSPTARMPPRKDRRFVEATSFDSMYGVRDRNAKTFGLRPTV